jgi:hypothetical protein
VDWRSISTTRRHHRTGLEDFVTVFC